MYSLIWNYLLLELQMQGGHFLFVIFLNLWSIRYFINLSLNYMLSISLKCICCAGGLLYRRQLFQYLPGQSFSEVLELHSCINLIPSTQVATLYSWEDLARWRKSGKTVAATVRAALQLGSQDLPPFLAYITVICTAVLSCYVLQ